MPVSLEELEKTLKQSFPNATIEIKDLVGDQNHYAAHIITEEFRGKSRVEQHAMVNKAVAKLLEGPLHALQIKTSLPQASS